MQKCKRCVDGLIERFGNCPDCGGKGLAGVPAFLAVADLNTPDDVKIQMANIVVQLALKGYVLRTRDDPYEVDNSFVAAAKAVNGPVVRRCCQFGSSALRFASMFNAYNMNPKVKGFHARNALLMGGDHFDNPVKFAVSWIESSDDPTTKVLIEHAKVFNIPFWNFARTETGRFWDWFNAQH